MSAIRPLWKTAICSERWPSVLNAFWASHWTRLLYKTMTCSQSLMILSSINSRLCFSAWVIWGLAGDSFADLCCGRAGEAPADCRPWWWVGVVVAGLWPGVWAGEVWEDGGCEGWRDEWVSLAASKPNSWSWTAAWSSSIPHLWIWTQQG